jgi:hypothetical protein
LILRAVQKMRNRASDFATCDTGEALRQACGFWRDRR